MRAGVVEVLTVDRIGGEVVVSLNNDRVVALRQHRTVPYRLGHLTLSCLLDLLVRTGRHGECYSSYSGTLMPTVALIPVKSFGLGNQRLSEAPSPLIKGFAWPKALGHHVAVYRRGGGADCHVFVSDDPEVAGWAAEIGFPYRSRSRAPGSTPPPMPESRGRWRATARWMVLHSDLPLSPAPRPGPDRQSSGGEAIAPSADGGTSAIAASRRIFDSHSAPAASIVTVPQPRGTPCRLDHQDFSTTWIHRT